MPYVHRKDGKISHLTNQPNGSEEFLSGDNQEVCEFLGTGRFGTLQKAKDSLKLKRNEILADVAEPGSLNMLLVIQVQLMLQQLNNQTLDAHGGYLRLGGVDYFITGASALLFLNDLLSWGLDVSDLKNQLYNSLSELTDQDLEAFDVNDHAWSVMPDITTYQ